MNNDNSPENSPQEDLSIGDLLRNEREKKGISKSRLAEDIKVRQHVIDALESEEWDKLPARVFIKGFIRSYTISIGYDTNKALRLFDKCVPSRGEDSPVPLTGNRKKSRAAYYAVPVLIILIVALYLFSTRDKTDTDVEPLQAVSETTPPPAESSPEASQPDQLESAAKTTSDEDKEPQVQEKTSPEPEKTAVFQETPPQRQKNTPVYDSRETVQERESAPAEESTEAGYGEEPPASESFSTETPGDMLTLSAVILDRTYVKIIIDDNPPKEAIFQPGANPSWNAERGFEITVGNAAGIELVFNGETFKNIGREGRVRTLRFPKDFKTNWEEE